MRMAIILMLVMGSISLSACSSMSGNVVPEKGPTMEQVYDSMEVSDTEHKTRLHQANTPTILPLNTTSNTFHKVPNPELKMYVYPHLAGKDEMPVPGYYTEFNAYTQDHYALPNEI
jgi:conjugative transfer region lipoprotein (TIGR03751 family)